MSLHALVEKWRAESELPADRLEVAGYKQACADHANELAFALAGSGDAVCWTLAHRLSGNALFADCIYESEEDAIHDAEALNGEAGDLVPLPLFTHPAGAVQVTDEIINYATLAYSRAEFEWYKELDRGDTPNMEPRHRVAMRAALNALNAALKTGGSP